MASVVSYMALGRRNVLSTQKLEQPICGSIKEGDYAAEREMKKVCVVRSGTACESSKPPCTARPSFFF